MNAEPSGGPRSVTGGTLRQVLQQDSPGLPVPGWGFAREGRWRWRPDRALPLRCRLEFRAKLKAQS